MKKLVLAILLTLSPTFLLSEEDPEAKILLKFGIQNIDQIECTSCWPNFIVAKSGHPVTIEKQESGKTIHLRLLAQRKSGSTKLTVTPLESVGDQIHEKMPSIFEQKDGNVSIFEYKGFDLTVSIELFKSRDQFKR